MGGLYVDDSFDLMIHNDINPGLIDPYSFF